MTSTVHYNGDLRTTITHLQSGNATITDAPLDNNGKGLAFSPTDLVATALASCMMTVMGIKARDKGLDMDGTTATVNKIMAASPRRIARVEVAFTFPPAAKNFSEADKKLLEKTALTCPVAQSLSAELEQEIAFVWP